MGQRRESLRNRVSLGPEMENSVSTEEEEKGKETGGGEQ